MEPLFLYLCYGVTPDRRRELLYNLQTLRAEVGFASPVVVYTDALQVFAHLDVQIVEAGLILNEARCLAYPHRAKLRVLADALCRFQRPIVMLDTDGFVRRGFAAQVRKALTMGVAMNMFVRSNPYPDCAPFETSLSHLGIYRLDPQAACMNNSGLIAVQADHGPIVEDAVALVDALWDAGLHRHDLEQFALTERLRLTGMPIDLINKTFVHYCPRWSKRYMRHCLRRYEAGTRIPFSKTRVRLFKAYWILRLAMRKLWP